MKYLRRFLFIVALLLLVVCTGTIIAYRLLDWERSEITDAVRSNSTSSFARLSDGVTEYELFGPDSAQVVVLASGASVPFYIWDPTFSALTKAGFRVLRYNYYGRGLSDRPRIPHTPELYNRQLNDLLNMLEIEAPVYLAGLSMGGWVTAGYAAANPDRVSAIVWIDPAHRSYAAPELPEWLARLYFVFRSQDETASGQLDDFLHPENFPDWVDRYKDQMHYSGFRFSRVSVGYHYAPVDHPADFRSVGASGIPVLLIWGREDRTLPFALSEEVRSLVPATFIPVDSSGHLPILEKSDEVNPEIVRFLSGVFDGAQGSASNLVETSE